MSDDTISRQAAIDAVKWGITYARAINTCTGETKELFKVSNYALNEAVERLKELPFAQPEQRYTEEELRVFQHGISLSLLSKRSSQHWQYDEDTATEIKFLERLYEKVIADMKGAERREDA